MIDLKKEWSISFAGCGFMGIYYVGACSCILEKFPWFIQGASKFYGSSAGALMATALSIGIPLEKCCTDLMFMAKEARKHKLGPLHPGYKLLEIVQDSLERCLPEDAHVRASGKLNVSLTRVSDGKNVLVSDFETRDELKQALICSCFVPFYCGVIPPTYRGVRYVDGAVSDNLPRCHLKNTITFSAYAGEIDLCPRLSTIHLHHVRFNNMSIQINSENIYRVTSTFFPPESEAMAKICQNGYMDALRFLTDNNLISGESPEKSFEACCELVKDLPAAEESRESGKTQQDGLKPLQTDHHWLNPQVIDKLPVNIKKALCESCRETHAAGGLLSQVTGYLPKIPSLLPVDSACSLAQRLVDWIPIVPKDMSWLYGMAGDVYKQAWAGSVKDSHSESPLRRCTSLPLDLNRCDQMTGDVTPLTMTPPATPTSGIPFTWNKHTETDHAPLTPPLTPTCTSTSGSSDVGVEASSRGLGGGWGLGRAVGWIRNIATDQTSNLRKTNDSATVPAFK